MNKNKTTENVTFESYAVYNSKNNNFKGRFSDRTEAQHFLDFLEYRYDDSFAGRVERTTALCEIIRYRYRKDSKKRNLRGKEVFRYYYNGELVCENYEHIAGTILKSNSPVLSNWEVISQYI